MKATTKRTFKKGGRVQRLLPLGSGPQGGEENAETIIFY